MFAEDTVLEIDGLGVIWGKWVNVRSGLAENYEGLCGGLYLCPPRHQTR